ncbi:MAG TPA: Crp/Fnr family transcriptional regulator, partial [Comamonadaceae bacterium]|nr:Crp/Fnr family transcriptional regulator [Comamonadaceae bacterium]
MNPFASTRSGSDILGAAQPPQPADLDGIPWLSTLDDEERERVKAALVVGDIRPGEYICRIGRPVTYWFGLLEGLLKMSNDDSQGAVITFTGVAPGGWFGEGTVIKREHYRYNIQALRK